MFKFIGFGGKIKNLGVPGTYADLSYKIWTQKEDVVFMDMSALTSIESIKKKLTFPNGNASDGTVIVLVNPQNLNMVRQLSEELDRLRFMALFQWTPEQKTKQFLLEINSDRTEEKTSLEDLIKFVLNHMQDFGFGMGNAWFIYPEINHGVIFGKIMKETILEGTQGPRCVSRGPLHF